MQYPYNQVLKIPIILMSMRLMKQHSSNKARDFDGCIAQKPFDVLTIY